MTLLLLDAGKGVVFVPAEPVGNLLLESGGTDNLLRLTLCQGAAMYSFKTPFVDQPLQFNQHGLDGICSEMTLLQRLSRCNVVYYVFLLSGEDRNSFTSLEEACACRETYSSRWMTCSQCLC